MEETVKIIGKEYGKDKVGAGSIMSLFEDEKPYYVSFSISDYLALDYKRIDNKRVTKSEVVRNE